MSDADSDNLSPADVLRLSADIVSAYVGRNLVPASGMETLIGDVYSTLVRLDPRTAPEPPPARRRPAVPVARSVQRDHIVCLEDGKQLKMLKRYLRAHYDLSPEEYRRRWGLPPDYPMVAPAYAERRSAFARQIGLGRGVRRRS